jgi:response regulator RpfG family c-di-GMP phosphodiesterase
MNDLGKRVRGLELLLRLGLDLHSERNLRNLLDRIWRELTRVLDAERSSLFLVSEDGDELYSVVAQGSEEIRFPKGKGIAGAVAASGAPLLIADAYADPRFNAEIDRKTGFRTRSILCVPLKNPRSEVVGVAQVLNRRDGAPFDGEDCGLLEALASMAAVAIETVQLYEEQIQATEAVIAGFLMALEMREGRQASLHSQVVRAYARAMAAAMGLPEEEARRTEWAAALHDVGKIAVSDGILAKNEPPSLEEMAEYEGHASFTQELLNAMAFSGELAGIEHIAPFHHKRFEGGGFPSGPPEGTEIPQGARIIAVADAVWVHMNSRWGTAGVSQSEALERIRSRAGTDFDPEAVRALCQLAPQLEELRTRMEGRTYVRGGDG